MPAIGHGPAMLQLPGHKTRDDRFPGESASVLAGSQPQADQPSKNASAQAHVFVHRGSDLLRGIPRRSRCGALRQLIKLQRRAMLFSQRLQYQLGLWIGYAKADVTI